MLDLTPAQLAALETESLEVTSFVAMWRPPATIAAGHIRWTDAPVDTVRQEVVDGGASVAVTYSAGESGIVGVQPPDAQNEGGRDLFALQVFDQDGAYMRDLNAQGHVGINLLVGVRMRAAGQTIDMTFYRGVSVAASWDFDEQRNGYVLSLSFASPLAKFDADYGMTTSEADQARRGADDNSMAHAHDAQDFEWGQPTGGF